MLSCRTLSGGLVCSITLSGDLLSILLSVPLAGVFASFGVLSGGSEGAGWVLPLYDRVPGPFSCVLTDGDLSETGFSMPRPSCVVAF